jgi:large subunit ribosomal protein L6
MSRVGKYPVALKDNVSVVISNNIVNVKGKRGESSISIPVGIEIKTEKGFVSVNPLNDNKETRAMWGSMRALISNMITGVSDGFKVSLDIHGVGLRASVQGKNLVMQLGFSHDVVFPIPEGITIVCPDQTHINIEGSDKQKVGQVAAKIRAYKKPEPYKGKGIKYSNEVVRRKEGKKK